MADVDKPRCFGWHFQCSRFRHKTRVAGYVSCKETLYQKGVKVSRVYVLDRGFVGAQAVLMFILRESDVLVLSVLDPRSLPCFSKTPRRLAARSSQPKYFYFLTSCRLFQAWLPSHRRRLAGRLPVKSTRQRLEKRGRTLPQLAVSRKVLISDFSH